MLPWLKKREKGQRTGRIKVVAGWLKRKVSSLHLDSHKCCFTVESPAHNIRNIWQRRAHFSLYFLFYNNGSTFATFWSKWDGHFLKNDLSEVPSSYCVDTQSRCQDESLNAGNLVHMPLPWLPVINKEKQDLLPFVNSEEKKNKQKNQRIKQADATEMIQVQKDCINRSWWDMHFT